MGRRPILQAVAVFVWAASVLAQNGTLSAQITNAAPDVRDLPGVLVSRHLLEAEALAVGDIVRLSADDTGDRTRPFRVVGVYEPTPDPLRITGRRLEARLHLPDLIDLTADPADPLSAESVTTMNVALVDPADAVAFAQDLDARVPGLSTRRTVRPLSPSEPLAVIERFHLAISIVTLIGSTMFLLALMVMRVEERRETAGVLRLLGVRRRRVILNTLAEGVLIALTGSSSGSCSPSCRRTASIGSSSGATTRRSSLSGLPRRSSGGRWRTRCRSVWSPLSCPPGCCCDVTC